MSATMPSKPLMSWSFDADSGEILAFGTDGAHRLGYDVEELRGRAVADITVAPRALREPLQFGGAWSGSLTLKHRNGTPIEVDAAMISTGEGDVRWVLMSRPSADGKTLLGHPAPLSNLLVPTTGELLRRLGDAAMRRAALMRELGAMTCDPKTYVYLDANALAREVLRCVSALADERHVELRLEARCGQVWLQPTAFSEALHELLDNALRASAPGQHVTVEVTRTCDGDSLWRVRDDGSGMSTSALASLGALSDVARQGGPGRGVAIAWAIVHGHGGVLHFDSNGARGTVASIWLPIGDRR